MKKIAIFLLLLASFSISYADGPFRNHRYDSWRVLDMPQNAIVFVGNSITDMHPWNEAFGGNPLIVNRGNSGTISREVLENMDIWLRFHPAKVFLMIGTNDLGWDSTVTSVVNNITTIVRRIRTESPTTQIYIQSVLPAVNQRSRSLATIDSVNQAIKALANITNQTTYIDLYTPLMGILEGAPYSLDNLHLTAYGYRLWCNIIEPYVGFPSFYPASTQQEQQLPSYGSHAMRASYFSMMPTNNRDVLFFGDEMVKNGEWNELLHNTHIKNRGTGWGYGGNIATTRAMVEASFYRQGVMANRDKPSKILLYTATEDVNGTKPLNEVAEDYKNLVSYIKQLSPNTPIVLVSLMPKNTADKRVQRFNRWLSQYAKTDASLAFCNIYDKLSLKGREANPRYIKENYLYGEGYIVVARALLPYLSNARVIGDAELNTLLNTSNKKAE